MSRDYSKKVGSAFGRLDVLANNAGVFRFGAFAEITERSFHFHYNINVLRAILTVQEAIKRFGTDGGSPAVRFDERRHRDADQGIGARTRAARDSDDRFLAFELTKYAYLTRRHRTIFRNVHLGRLERSSTVIRCSARFPYLQLQIHSACKLYVARLGGFHDV